MAKAISLKVETNTAVSALQKLDSMLKKLDKTMQGMKGMPEHVTQGEAELKAKASAITERQGLINQGESSLRIPGDKAKGRQAKKNFKALEATQASEVESLTKKIEALIPVLEKRRDLELEQIEIRKKQETQQKAGMQAVAKETSARSEMNKEIAEGIRHAQRLGIPLTEKQNDILVEFRSRVDQARKGVTQLTKEDKKFAVQLGVTGRAIDKSGKELKKKNNVLEELRLTVSRTRNITLLYAFAVRPLQNIIRDVSTQFTEYEKAMLGANRVAERFGVSSSSLRGTMEQFTSTGLLDTTEVSGALKTLLSTGIGLPKSVELLEAFGDAAAFNRQGTLELGQALLGATQGFKNMNSRMVDNAGITKNLNVILKEQAFAMGKQVKDLTEMEKKQAIANGLIKEASMFQGDLARATNTVSGAFAKGDLEMEKVGRQIGKFAEKNGLLFKFAKATQDLGITFQRVFMTDLEKSLDVIQRAGVATEKTIDSFARLSARDRILDTAETFQQTSAKNMGLFTGGLFSAIDLDPLATQENLQAQREMLEESLKAFRETSLEKLKIARDELEKNQTMATKFEQENRNLFEGEKYKGAFTPGGGAGTALGGTTDERSEELKQLDEYQAKARKSRENLEALGEAQKSQIKLLTDLIELYKVLAPEKLKSAKIDEDINALNADQNKLLEKLQEKLKQQQDQFGEQALSAPAKAIKGLEKDLNALMRTINKELPKGNQLVKDLVKGFNDIYALRQQQTIEGLIQSQNLRTMNNPSSMVDDEKVQADRDIEDKYNKMRKALEEIIKLEKTTKEQREQLTEQTLNLNFREAEEKVKVAKEIDEKRKDSFKKAMEAIGVLEEGKNAKLKILEEENIERIKKAIEQRVIAETEGEELIAKLKKLIRDRAAQNDAEDRRKEIEDRYKEVDQQIAQLNQFASSMTKITRGMDRMAKQAARNAAAVISAAGQAAAALKALDMARDKASVLGQISAVASLVATGVDLASTLFGKDDETQEREARRRNRQFGATINRGPQTLYLTPTLVVNADGDVIFSEDGLEVVNNRQVELIQQSFDNGNIEIPTDALGSVPETYR